MAKSKEQESPITKKDYSRLAFVVIAGGLAGGLFAYSADGGFSDITKTAAWVGAGLAAYEAARPSLLDGLDSLLGSFERLVSSNRSKKAQVTAVFAPTQEETPKKDVFKGDTKIVNGKKWRFENLLEYTPFLKSTSHSTTKENNKIPSGQTFIIRGDSSHPKKEYAEGEMTSLVLRNFLKRADPPTIPFSKDRGQYISFRSKNLNEATYWLCISSLTYTESVIGFSLREKTGRRRLVYNHNYTFKVARLAIALRNGYSITYFPPPPLPRGAVATDSTPRAPSSSSKQ